MFKTVFTTYSFFMRLIFIFLNIDVLWMFLLSVFLKNQFPVIFWRWPTMSRCCHVFYWWISLPSFWQSLACWRLGLKVSAREHVWERRSLGCFFLFFFLQFYESLKQWHYVSLTLARHPIINNVNTFICTYVPYNHRPGTFLLKHTMLR